MTNLKNARSLDDFAKAIRETWRNSVADILAVARTLAQAREELDKFAFQELTARRLKFSKGTISKFLAIAGDARLAKISAGKLPACWSTLYALTRLSDEELAEGLRRNVVRADMLRADIARLKPPKPDRARPPRLPKSALPADEVAQQEVFLILSSVAPDLDEERRVEFFERMRAMLDQIEKNAAASAAARAQAEAPVEDPAPPAEHPRSLWRLRGDVLRVVEQTAREFAAERRLDVEEDEFIRAVKANFTAHWGEAELARVRNCLDEDIRNNLNGRLWDNHREAIEIMMEDAQ